MATLGSSQVQTSHATAAVGTDEDKVVDVVHVSEGEEDSDDDERPSKRKLTSAVWNDFEKVCVDGVWKAKCNHCNKRLSATSRNGTTHLKTRLKTCIYNNKKPGTKVQTNLRFGTT
jgi:hypothetical protein